MLYPVVSDKKLYEYCKNCGYKEENKDYVIYNKSYSSSIGHENGVRKYLAHDNTLARTIHYKCPNDECASHKDDEKKEAVFFNDHGSLKLVYICTECNTEWRYN